MEARDQTSPCHNDRVPEFRFFCVLMLSKGRRNKKTRRKRELVCLVRSMNATCNSTLTTPFSVLKSILLLILRNEQTTGSSHLVNIAMCMEPACLALSLLSKTNYE
ncbi:hypothetical protein NC652_000463 [Populus alba x Populus x berolinensis]|nr:hypothetical protein NC652_000463 [Populus alba x Populus x berolinensis]